MSKPKPIEPVDWSGLTKAFGKRRQIDRALWFLLGFVIGALAMYASFPEVSGL